MTKVAIIGTQGVPAKYGGFESLVENLIGKDHSPDIDYTVLCSAKDLRQDIKEYKGAHLKYVPLLRANGVQSIPYDMVSMLKAVNGYDAILVLGVSGCIFLPILKFFSKSKIIVNIDGLEHKREKWGKFARSFLKYSESVAVHNADIVISDNKGIQDYVTGTYNKKSEMIAYGGDHVLRNVDTAKEAEVLNEYRLEPERYSMTVCRIEPENNCHMTLEAFSRTDKVLAFIGNWNRSEYGISLKKKYCGYSNIKMLDPIYDLDTLFVLRKNCYAYIHGHSAGGTNPSLVEAMFFGRPILCYDVIYNRSTTFGNAYYFKDSGDIRQILDKESLDGHVMKEIAEQNYTWAHIVAQYERLY